MTKDLELFKDLFTQVPNISILHINNSLPLLNNSLEQIREFNGGKIDYIEFINQNSAKLKAVAREYEYIVLSDIIKYCSNQEEILRLMYKALENSGNLIILEKIDDSIDLYELLKLLEDIDFQAPNNIELFQGYYLITAKKMHHWGKSL